MDVKNFLKTQNLSKFGGFSQYLKKITDPTDPIFHNRENPRIGVQTKGMYIIKLSHGKNKNLTLLASVK